MKTPDRGPTVTTQTIPPMDESETPGGGVLFARTEVRDGSENVHGGDNAEE
jgi:hypothetical protein